MGEQVEGARRLPAASLRSYVTSYAGYRLSGFEAGTHVGMPGPDLTVVVAIDSQVEFADSVHQGACAFGALASGISAEPVTIAHDGSQHGIQLSLTPEGARAVFGVPTAALGDWMVELSDVLPDAAELVDRVSENVGWQRRFDIVDEILSRSVRERSVDPTLTEAWRRLVRSADMPRVDEVARDVGWSRRYLITRFTGEFGVSPKAAARIARFHRSHRMLRRPVAPRLADVAAACGYYDQAHMAREWREMAGASPTQWRKNEKFAFVQDDEVASDDTLQV